MGIVKLLLLNSLKGLKKKKIQMLGIIVMVMLSTGIYTTMNSAIDRIEDRYYHYLEENKVEHVSLDANIDYGKDVSFKQFMSLRKTHFNGATAQENELLDLYMACLSNQTNMCNTNLYLAVEQVFKKYDAYLEIAHDKMSHLANKYDFEYELQHTKIVTENNYTINIMPYDTMKKLNLPYLIEGKFPERAGEITVLPKFAKANHLEIGDSYKINGKQYKIVGYAYASDYIYPMLSMNQPIFDEKYNNIIFMLPSDYELCGGIKNDTFAVFLNGNYSRKNRITISVGPEHDMKEEKLSSDKMIEKAKKDGDSVLLINTMLENEKDTLKVSMNTMIRLMRTDMIQMEFDSNRTFAEMFLYLLLSISVFIILVITKKRIDDERLQIGVLKSLGYKRYQIALSYLVYPLVGSFVGALIGYFIGIVLHKPLTNIFLSFYTVPLSGFKMNPKYFINSLLVPMVMLSLLSFIIAYGMLHKKPLALLKEGSNLKVNFLSKITNKLTRFLPFESKFRYQLASRSVGKLLIVTLTSFCTGLLIVLIIIGSNLFHSMIDQSFDTMKYKYMVSYNTPQKGDNIEDDLILSTSMKITNIVNKNGKKKNLVDADYTVNFTGIDSYTKYIRVLDELEHNLIPKLYEEENGIVINKNVSEYMKVELGDTLTFDLNGHDVSYQVVGISESYLQASAYISREELSKILGYHEIVYTSKYSINQKYQNMNQLSSEELEDVASIFSIEDLRRNIEKQVERMDASIYIVIFFAAFMVLIIIAVIANIVVEENKKTISLMKVMGYHNKEISSIVLNIYTPFIIFAYLLAIPSMISILKAMMHVLLKDTKMVMPISISPMMALVGLVTLLIAYYIAISLSKRVLNKVPLAVALKRE